LTELHEETLAQTWAIGLMAAFTVSWFFCLGACFGSFLNVIVWRWPRGRTLWREGSNCPQCHTPIRWHDNLPIWGWLRLRGRCRDCAMPISARYPLMEALVGVQFVVLLMAEALTGGATLPVRPIDPYAGVVWIIWYARQPELLRLFALHVSLLYLANIVWLIAEDRQRLPKAIWGWLPPLGLVLVASWPDLHPTLGIFQSYMQAFTWPQRFAGLLSAAGGGLAGLMLGGLLTRTITGESRDLERSPLVLLLTAAGLALGWSAVVSLGLLTTITAGGRWLLGRMVPIAARPLAPLFDLWLMLPVQLLTWRWLDQQTWWPGTSSPWWVSAAAIVVTGLLAETWRSPATSDSDEAATLMISSPSGDEAAVEPRQPLG
jgi:leader peptidase (prepilin peptidase)/N-methyltransferase